jgi:hypothetical protein
VNKSIEKFTPHQYRHSRMSAVCIAGGLGMVDGVDDLKFRREALQIAVMLPPDRTEALLILKLTEELVRGFLSGKDTDPPAPKPPLRLV